MEDFQVANINHDLGARHDAVLEYDDYSTEQRSNFVVHE